MKKLFLKKEAQQLAAVVLVAGIALVYGIWTFAVVPMRRAAHNRSAKYADLAGRNLKAQEAVAAIPDHEAALAAMNADLDRIVRDYATRPVLGSSYQLGLRQRLDPLAQKAAFTLQSLAVQNPEPLPRRRPEAPLSLCTADIRGLGSYEQIRDFIAYIESDNPYIHVAGLTINTHPSDPKRHRVALRLECVSAPAEPPRL